MSTRLLVLLSALLLAGPAGAFTIDISTNNGGSRTYTGAELGCVPNAEGTAFNCSSDNVIEANGGDESILDEAPYTTEFWDMDGWNFDTDIDPFINGLVALTNNQATDAQFTLLFNQLTGPFGAGGTVIGGSLQGGLTADGSGGSLSVPGGSAFYQGLIDGAPAASLYPDPPGFSVSVGAFGSDNVPSQQFGAPIPSLPAGPVSNSIGIQLDFLLTPGDQASFTSVFVVEVPEPGLALLLSGALLALALPHPRRP